MIAPPVPFYYMGSHSRSPSFEELLIQASVKYSSTVGDQRAFMDGAKWAEARHSSSSGWGIVIAALLLVHAGAALVGVVFGHIDWGFGFRKRKYFSTALSILFPSFEAGYFCGTLLARPLRRRSS